MSSDEVSKEIKRTVWPALKEIGFTHFTSRSAWRDKKDTIEIINFQSFNDYLATRIGCTTFSFAVNLGAYYKCVDETLWAKKRTRLPQEYQCQARLHLIKSIHQDGLFNPYGSNVLERFFSKIFSRRDKYDCPEIWYVIKDGTNIKETVADAKNSIFTQGISWLDKMENLRYALEAFKNRKGVGATWKAPTEDYGGRIGSLSRMETTAAIYIFLGKPKLAKEILKSVYENKFYSRNNDVLQEIRRKINLIND